MRAKNKEQKKATKTNPVKDLDRLSSRHGAGFVPVDVDDLSLSDTGAERSHEVSDEIAQITKASEHLCLFSVVYNALRNNALRNALTSMNPSLAALAFVELSKSNIGSCTEFKPIDRTKHCYTSLDMSRYLQQLKKEKHIKAYTFKQIHGHKLHNVFEYLFVKPLPENEEFTYLFMGYTLRSDEKKKRWKTGFEIFAKHSPKSCEMKNLEKNFALQ